MDISQFLEKINSHTTSIYESDMHQVMENGNTVNWLLGLAGGALIFSFNNYEPVNNNDLPIIIIQSFVFIAIIAIGFLIRTTVKSFKDLSYNMIKKFNFLKISFELVPDDLEEELKNERLHTVFHKYVNGEYFQDEDELEFNRIAEKRSNCETRLKVLSISAIILMIVQFFSFFLLILN